MGRGSNSSRGRNIRGFAVNGLKVLESARVDKETKLRTGMKRHCSCHPRSIKGDKEANPRGESSWKFFQTRGNREALLLDRNRQMIRSNPAGLNFPLRKILDLATFDFHFTSRFVPNATGERQLSRKREKEREKRRGKRKGRFSMRDRVHYLGPPFHKEMTRYTPFLRDASSLRQSHSVLCRGFQLARDALSWEAVFFPPVLLRSRLPRQKREKEKKEGGHRQTEKLGQFVKIEPTKLEWKRLPPTRMIIRVVIWNESSISESVAICRTLFA